MIWLGAALLLAAVLLLAWPVIDFLAEPGYGSFDMTSASAFDLKWLRGSVTAGIALGVLTGSWPVGVASALVTMFSSMLVKPALVGVVRRGVARAADPESGGPRSRLDRLKAAEGGTDPQGTGADGER